MNYGRAYSPPCEGGVSAPSKMVPFRKRRGRGGRSQVMFRNNVLKHWLVSDHPVCGPSVAARLFIDAAATPPLQGGECAPLNSSTIPLQVLKAATIFILCFAASAPSAEVRPRIRAVTAFIEIDPNNYEARIQDA